MAKLIVDKLSANEVESISAPLELDLLAFFNVLYEDIMSVVEDNKNQEPDIIINAVNKILL